MPASAFLPSMISLSSISPWTSLHALETVREAGYTGTPFEPLECYRQALWKKMQETQSRRGGTPSKVYLTAKAAFAASEHDLKLLTFVLGRTAESETSPAVVVVTAPVVVRRKRGKVLDPPAVERKCTGVYKSVLDAAVKKPVVKGFISRKRTGRVVATPASSVVRKRKHMEEPKEEEGEEEEGEEEGHVSPPKKRGGWLY